jgi:hypothetical protein
LADWNEKVVQVFGLGECNLKIAGTEVPDFGNVEQRLVPDERWESEEGQSLIPGIDLI